MRKFENVDVVAALGAVVELNTEHYKSDFKYDVEMFKEAARNPDGENNRFLWLSRPSGTYCQLERDTYIRDTAAFNYWNGCATILGKDTPNEKVIVNDRVMTFAVEVTGIKDGRVMGNLHELNYRDHVRQLNRAALPLHTVTATYKDGTTLTLPHKEHDAQHLRLHRNHGQLQTLTPHPKNADALRDVLTQAREQREKGARPAAFKVRVSTPKQQPKNAQPSIKQQLDEGKKQLDAKRAAAPKRTATKNKNTGLGD
jgi:hypothetical protein